LRLCVRQITHAKAQSSPRLERTLSFDTASLIRSKKFAQGAKILTDSSTKDTKVEDFLFVLFVTFVVEKFVGKTSFYAFVLQMETDEHRFGRDPTVAAATLHGEYDL
jgi:hypothetical protein